MPGILFQEVPTDAVLHADEDGAAAGEAHGAREAVLRGLHDLGGRLHPVLSEQLPERALHRAQRLPLQRRLRNEQSGLSVTTPHAERCVHLVSEFLSGASRSARGARTATA